MTSEGFTELRGIINSKDVVIEKLNKNITEESEIKTELLEKHTNEINLMNIKIANLTNDIDELYKKLNFTSLQLDSKSEILTTTMIEEKEQKIKDLISSIEQKST